jgi:S-formylglutathione hydrolase FrmB
MSSQTLSGDVWLTPKVYSAYTIRMGDPMRNKLRLLLAVSLTLGSCAVTDELSETSAEVDAPNFVSHSGITVQAVRWVSPRTLEVDVATAFVHPNAVNGPHRLRVTLPTNYFQNPTARFPVLYLLQGGAGGNSAQWTTGGGAVEPITAGKPIITVMADGGKVGWFTNWVDQSQGAQRWADFYLQQVIPWVDNNMRTVAAKNGRAIAGLSMGGYGAVRLAQDRPDLFASVASFSGAVDLGDLGTRTVITEQALQNLFNPFGPFGNPFWPSDAGFNAQDPMRRAPKLAGLQVLLYAGAGTSDVDILERTMGQSADRFAKKLVAANIPHTWWMYGRPGPGSPFGCDGGHNFSCWNFALNDALPKILTVLQVPNTPPPPPGVNLVVNPGFEGGQGGWGCLGTCGVDGAGLAHGGNGNAWVRNTEGWNDVDQTLAVAPNKTYTVSAWVRTSANNTAGFFGLRTPTGQVLGEKSFGDLPGYTKLTVTVNSGANTSLTVFGGLWANGDTWAQLDDVSVVGN